MLLMLSGRQDPEQVAKHGFCRSPLDRQVPQARVTENSLTRSSSVPGKFFLGLPTSFCSSAFALRGPSDAPYSEFIPLLAATAP